jgi:hypothetical protein
MRSGPHRRFLSMMIAGYLCALTVQQWTATGITPELIGLLLVSAVAILVALYALVAS